MSILEIILSMSSTEYVIWTVLFVFVLFFLHLPELVYAVEIHKRYRINPVRVYFQSFLIPGKYINIEKHKCDAELLPEISSVLNYAYSNPNCVITIMDSRRRKISSGNQQWRISIDPEDGDIVFDGKKLLLPPRELVQVLNLFNLKIKNKDKTILTLN